MPVSIAAMLSMVVILCNFPDPVLAQENTSCIVGELPHNAAPKEFVRPRIPLSCWRSEREGDGSGIYFKVYFDVTPDGRTENIRVDAVDPVCAREPIENMVREWRYDCSDAGAQNRRVIMTISSPVN